MTWRPPKQIVFGHGRNRLVVPVRVLKLADFQRECVEHSNGLTWSDPMPKGLSCSCGAILLREDRRHLPAFRHDLTHEIDHCYVDWRGTFFEP